VHGGEFTKEFFIRHIKFNNEFLVEESRILKIMKSDKGKETIHLFVDK